MNNLKKNNEIYEYYLSGIKMQEYLVCKILIERNGFRCRKNDFEQGRSQGGGPGGPGPPQTGKNYIKREGKGEKLRKIREKLRKIRKK